MAGSGAAARTRTQARGRRQQPPRLPFDVLVDIVVRTDPTTLVRCAATCQDMRRRIKDHAGLRGRLRLRHGDRFVQPLLRGYLIRSYTSTYDGRGRRKEKEELFLQDTTAPDATRLRRAASGGFPLASCDGLVLARVGVAKELRVCDPATRSSQILPPEPAFPNPKAATKNYVLLVGGDQEDASSVGRHFHVVMAHLDLSEHRRHLLLQISSEHGVWEADTEIRAHNLTGSHLQRGLGKALVIGGAVHWLCLTDTGACVLKLHVRAMNVTVTTLPESFPHRGWQSNLLATSSAGGRLIVLVADGEKISIWAQSKQAKWQQRPQVVIEEGEILNFLDKAGGSRPWLPVQLFLVWFAVRSGTVLINMSSNGYFWLDLQSMKIVRWFSNQEVPYATANVPYEMNLGVWVPTFSSTL